MADLDGSPGSEIDYFGGRRPWTPIGARTAVITCLFHIFYNIRSTWLLAYSTPPYYSSWPTTSSLLVYRPPRPFRNGYSVVLDLQPSLGTLFLSPSHFPFPEFAC